MSEKQDPTGGSQSEPVALEARVGQLERAYEMLAWTVEELYGLVEELGCDCESICECCRQRREALRAGRDPRPSAPAPPRIRRPPCPDEPPGASDA